MKKQKKLLIIDGVLLAIFLILNGISRLSTDFSDWYAQHIYKFFVVTIGRFMSIFPFAFIEILILILALLVVIKIILFVYDIIKKNDKISNLVTGIVFQLITLIIILLVINTFTCGINYYRRPFSYYSGLTIKERPVEELISASNYLVNDINEIADKLKTNNDNNSYSDVDINKKAQIAMETLGNDYKQLSGYYPQPKPLIASFVLSYQYTVGVYSSFTIEATYNDDVLDYEKPFTACHELSHLRGFMREDEANFIAYLGCLKSDSVFFRYSADMEALIYCTNALWDAGYEQEYYEIMNKLPDVAKRDIIKDTEFWSDYDTKIKDVADKVNDTYLKANDQKDGVLSYDRFVDLLLAYFEKNGIK